MIFYPVPKSLKHIAFSFLLFPGLALHAQDLGKKHWQIDANLFLGEILKPDDQLKRILKDGTCRTYDLKLGYKDFGDSAFAPAYNYPTLGIGLAAIDFSDAKMSQEPQHVGNIYTLYGFIDRTLFRLNKVKFNYIFEAGIGYNTDIYDQYTNANKIFSSFPVMVYIGIGLGLKYNLFDRLEVGMNAEAKHLSNGRLAIMNKGLNIWGASINMTYYFSPIVRKFPKAITPPFKKHFYYHVIAGGGIQTYLEDLLMYSYKPADANQGKRVFNLYPKYSVSSDISYRLFRKYGCGIGLDLFYVPHTSVFQEYDAARDKAGHLKYNSLSLGIAFNQELYYNNIAASASLGYYLYRELGQRDDERSLYQRAGFRYYFPKMNNLFMGVSVKAHKFRKAEYIEFSVGKKWGGI